MAIINCPECGHEVSSAAEKCPNCGVAIAGNIMTCPDCGRVVLRSTTTCPSCGAKLTAPAAAQGGYKAPQPERREQYNNTDPYAAQQSEEPKKKKKGPLMAVIIVVAVIVIGVLAYVLIGNAQSAKSEQEAYESVIASSDTALYGQYLRDYPDGKHAEEVKAKLATLVAEIKDWNDACVNNTRSSFATFLTNHPGSPYEQACKDKIDSLDYQDALAAGTVDALQMYISSHPDGKYLDEAAAAQKNINDTKVQPDESAAIKSLCSQFFTALSEKDDAALTQTVAAKMDNFLNKRGATHADVMNFANKLNSGETKKNFTVNNDYRITKMPQPDGEVAYRVAFSVDENSLGAEGEEKLSSYYVTAVVNAQMKITQLGMRHVSNEE